VSERISDILSEVAQRLGKTPDDLIAQNRSPVLVAARRYVMWRAHVQGHSLTKIGRAMKRHHTTVLDGVRAIDRAMHGERPLFHSQFNPRGRE